MRVCAGRADETVRLDGRGEVVGGADAVEGTVAGCSAGRVVVPGRLKFCSSFGPMASVGGVSVVAGWVVLWASAGAAESHSPPVNKTLFQRKPALISSRFVLETPS